MEPDYVTERREPHQFCHYCGTPYEQKVWPRACQACKQMTWRGPQGVVVMVVPVRTAGAGFGVGHPDSQNGLLSVRRAIEPRKGWLSLPSGYIGWGEDWRDAACRELHEETGVTCDPSKVDLLTVVSAPTTLLVFCKVPTIQAMDFKPNDHENSEVIILDKPEELAFESHTEMAKKFFKAPVGFGR